MAGKDRYVDGLGYRAIGKPDEPKGFEKTEYGADTDPVEVYAAVKQAVKDIERRDPAAGLLASFHGSALKLQYHSYEMLLHRHRGFEDVLERANARLDELAKHLKKEVKAKTGHALKLKPMKEKWGNSVEKVSMNERYLLRFWRFYEVG